MWIAFNENKKNDNISAYITSASVCTNHDVKNKVRSEKEGVLTIEAQLPSSDWLSNIKSDTPSVDFMVQDLNFRSKSKSAMMSATINAAKAVEPKSSLLSKLVEVAVRALTPARVGASVTQDSEKLLPPLASEMVAE
jgi:hypothetical protein